MDLILFRNKFFADVIKLRREHAGLRCTLNLLTRILTRDDTQKYTQREESHAKTKAEIRVMHLQAKECQALLAAIRS